jgi:hypothetical protein
MVFSDSGNVQQNYNDYYSRSQKYNSSKISSEKTESDKERFKLTFNNLLQVLDQSSSICDVGCGGGGMLAYLYERGFKNLTGIDSGQLNEEVINNKYKYIQSTIFNLEKYKLAKFKAIICTGVLEHIYDLKEAIPNIVSLMESDGYFYIEVPDASLYSENVVSPFQDFNLEHINHFSQTCLINLMSKYGLELASIRTVYQSESNRYEMPVISALFIKSQKLLSFKVQFDIALIMSIKKYIEESTNLLKKINCYLLSELNGITSVYIWGAGQLSLKLLNLEIFKKVTVLGVIDRNSTIPTINNVGVMTDLNQIERGVPILIGSILYVDSIKRDIEILKISNPLIDLIIL